MPNLDIELQADNHSVLGPIYRSGDVIRGKVTYQIRKEKEREGFNGIELVLSGDVSIRSLDDATVTQSKDYFGMYEGVCVSNRDRTMTTRRSSLFAKSIILSPISSATTKQTIEFPFELAFPVDGEYLEFTASTGTNGLAPPQKRAIGALPPSLTWRIRERGKQSIDTICVSYTLGARLMGSEAFGTEITIDHPPRESTIPPPQPMMCSRSFDTITWTHRHLSSAKGNRFSRLLHSSSSDSQVPTMSFTPNITFAEAFNCWQPIPVTFSISNYTISDPAASVHLDLASLRINLMTNRAAGGSYTADSVPQNLGAFLVYPELELPTDGTRVTVKKDFRLCDMAGLKNGTVPDLEVINLKLQHVIEVSASIKHRESGHIFKVETEMPVRVLEPYFAKGKGSDQGAVNRRANDEDVAPPAYYDKLAVKDS
ncbi:hypothetical protein MBLNU457_3483t1 [Dothideomycetes sp. NU457]